MATSASQPYIAKLGFLDRDRSNERHGLACEYLLERLIELEVAPSTPSGSVTDSIYNPKWWPHSPHHECKYVKVIAKIDQGQTDAAFLMAKSQIKSTPCINVPIGGAYTKGFADVFACWRPQKPFIRNQAQIELPAKGNTLLVGSEFIGFGPGDARAFLGEVKITKEPAEVVLQQINFYREHLRINGETIPTYILADYDPSTLQRLVEGTDIKVFRLGKRFDEWIANRPHFDTEEL